MTILNFYCFKPQNDGQTKLYKVTTLKFSWVKMNNTLLDKSGHSHRYLCLCVGKSTKKHSWLKVTISIDKLLCWIKWPISAVTVTNLLGSTLCIYLKFKLINNPYHKLIHSVQTWMFTFCGIIHNHYVHIQPHLRGQTWKWLLSSIQQHILYLPRQPWK